MPLAGRASAPLPFDLRVRLWDEALAATREWFRAQGLRETSTPVRVGAPAIEPFIAPIAAPPGYLATSPELAMKRLLCRGSGSIFQIAHVFREGERGAWHAEEFHLVEWYRQCAVGEEDAAFLTLGDDLAALVEILREVAVDLGVVAGDRAKLAWERVECLALLATTLGVPIEELASLVRVEQLLETVRALEPIALDSSAAFLRSPEGGNDRRLRELEVWTELFSLWSDRFLDPLLAARGSAGVHLVGFPPPLAALSRVRDGVAWRVESYACGVEIANGYLELRDEVEQRRRFELVADSRRRLGWPSLPLDEEFLAELANPGLPPCVGMAMGFERALMVACGRDTIAEVALLPTGTVLG